MQTQDLHLVLVLFDSSLLRCRDLVHIIWIIIDLQCVALFVYRTICTCTVCVYYCQVGFGVSYSPVQYSLYFINEINILEGKFCTVQPQFSDIKLTTYNLVPTFQRPFLHLLHKNNIFSSIVQFSDGFLGDQKCH